MVEFFEGLWRSIEPNLWRIGGAILLLVIGWLFSLAVAGGFRALLRRTEVDDRMARWLLGEESARKIKVESVLSRALFYLLMLMVLVGVFSILGVAIEPLNRFLNAVVGYLPQIAGAVVVVGLAWVVATVLKVVLLGVLTKAKLDERLGPPAEGEKRVPLSKTVAETVYWLVFLFFLPAVLGVLRLHGLLEPVQAMMQKFLVFLPNVIVAGLILAGGWFLARIVQRLTGSLTAAAGVDRLGQKAGLPDRQRISGLLGLLTYVFVLIPVLIAALNALQLQALTEPASRMLQTILDALPRIFAAGVILVLAYLVGRIVAGLATQVAAGAGMNALPERLGLGAAPPEGSRAPAGVFGMIVLAAIMVFAGMEAAEVLGFHALASLLQNFLVFAGKVALGLIILGLGLFLAHLAARTVQASGAAQAGLLALLARISILVFTVALALSQMELAEDIVRTTLGVVLLGLAVAFALAFGLGGREIAARELDGWISRLREGRRRKP